MKSWLRFTHSVLNDELRLWQSYSVADVLYDTWLVRCHAQLTFLAGLIANIDDTDVLCLQNITESLFPSQHL